MKTNMNSKNYFSILLASALALCGNAAWAAPAAESDFTFDSTTGTITGYKGAGGDVEIPATIGGVTVTAIGGAFVHNASLKSVTIPASVTNIWDVAFASSGMTNVTFAAGSQLKTIGESAFNLTWMKELTIPASVREIGTSAFARNESLLALTFEEGSQLEVIGDSAFNDCYMTNAVVIPASVKHIGYQAFSACLSAAAFIFAEGSQLETIGGQAFLGICSVKDFTIPASVTNIGNKAFSTCDQMTNLTVLATTPPTAGEDLFQYCPSELKIRVPEGTAAAYKAADGWSAYADLITDGTIETTYFAWNGTEVTGPLTTNATPVTADMTTLNSGWYVVQGQVVMPDHGLVVNGDAHLILCDEAKLAVTGAMDKAGIEVAVVGSTTNSLTIYGQEKQSGRLEVAGGEAEDGEESGPEVAAIGGSREHLDCGRVTIDGGTIVVPPGCGAGIGSACRVGEEGVENVSAIEGGFGGVITINGGTVVVEMGTPGGGAGLGGGMKGDGGSVTINGGTVRGVTYGNESMGPGIGAGMFGGNIAVTINDGTVDIDMCEVDGEKDSDGGSAAAIGASGDLLFTGGCEPKVITVTINGGTVTARSCVGAGIGTGLFGVDTVRVVINGGTVFAEGGYCFLDVCGGAGIGGGSVASGADVLINGGTVTAISHPVEDDDDKLVWSSGIGAGYFTEDLEQVYGPFDMGTFALGPNTTAMILSGMDTNGTGVAEVQAADYGTMANPGWCTNCYVKIEAVYNPVSEGSPENPWKVGVEGSEDTVQAHTNGTGKVIVTGAGTPKTFAAGEEPWAGAVPAITEIVVPREKVDVFKAKWPAFKDLITDGIVAIIVTNNGTTTNYYDSVQAAFDSEFTANPAVTNTVTLIRDYTETRDTMVNLSTIFGTTFLGDDDGNQARTARLDLNGHVLTGGRSELIGSDNHIGPAIIVNSGSVLIIDDSSAEGSGAIRKPASDPVTVQAANKNGMLQSLSLNGVLYTSTIANRGDLVLAGGTIHGKPYLASDGKKYAIGVFGYTLGSFIMSGGSIVDCSAADMDIMNGDMPAGILSYYGSVVITDGRVKDLLATMGGSFTISGGLFGNRGVEGMDIGDWLVDGVTLSPNTDPVTLAEGYNWKVAPPPAWANLQVALTNDAAASLTCAAFEHTYENGTNFVKLLADIVADTNVDTRLLIETNSIAVLDLNGFTLDRGLTDLQSEDTGLVDGWVMTVCGQMTVTDTSAAHNGKITGGYGTICGVALIGTHRGKGIEKEDVLAKNAVFVLENGIITGNACNHYDDAGTGCIRVEQGTFRMLGGWIVNNIGGFAGAGFTDSECYDGQEWGVRIELRGGEISGNSALMAAGVYSACTNSESLFIGGSIVITNNTGELVGGLYANAATFGGSPVIRDNVGPMASNMIFVEKTRDNPMFTPVESASEPLVEGADIRVTALDASFQPASAEHPVKILTNCTASAAQYFHSEIPDTVVFFKNDALWIGAAPGNAANPWDVGTAGNGQPMAYTNGTGRVIVIGEGEPKTYGGETPAPWADAQPPIDEIVVPQGKVDEFKEKWPDYADKITDLTIADVTYFAWNGETVTGPFTTNARPVTADMTVLESGWYVTEGVVSNFDGIIVKGDVHLILADGAELYVGPENEGVFGFDTAIGVNVDPNGYTNSIAIYAQALDSTGKLIARGSVAGIGSYEPDGLDLSENDGILPVDCGLITIHGGDIAASSHRGTGIGGCGGEGYSGVYGGTITIYGGKVDACGGGYGAGIGSAGALEFAGNSEFVMNPSCCVNIYGGEVTARQIDFEDSEGMVSAGIGGGIFRNGGIVNIYGGTVRAYSQLSAGIGAGFGGRYGYVTVYGGDVTAVSKPVVLDPSMPDPISASGIGSALNETLSLGTPGEFAFGPGTEGTILVGMDPTGAVTEPVAAEDFRGTVHEPGWYTNCYVHITAEQVPVAQIVTDGGATTNIYYSLQDAFDSQFTADQSVTNTVTLLRDWTSRKIVTWRDAEHRNVSVTSILGVEIEDEGTANGTSSETDITYEPRTARLDLNGFTLTGGLSGITTAPVAANGPVLNVTADSQCMPAIGVMPGSVLIVEDSSVAQTGAIRKPAATYMPILLSATGTLGAGRVQQDVPAEVPAIAVIGGDFTLVGGKIHGERTYVMRSDYALALGVLVTGGRFTMTGGAIVDCANEVVLASNALQKHGDDEITYGSAGVTLQGASAFTMTGGKVKDAIQVLGEDSAVAISGGLFGTEDVTTNAAWIASGYIYKANDDAATLAEGYNWKVCLAPLPGSAENPWKVGAEVPEDVIVYTNGNGGLVLKGEGSIGDNKPWLGDGIPETITEIGISGDVPVTPQDFENFDNIEKIVVPHGQGETYKTMLGDPLAQYVEEVPDYLNFTASWPTSDPEDFVIEDGVLTYYKGPGGIVGIPRWVTSIGDRAFYDLRGVETVFIPKSVTNIGMAAFAMVGSLTAVYIEDGSRLETIGDGAFSSTSIEKINIPDSVKTIGGGAFSGCTELTTVRLGNGLESIGWFAFDDGNNGMPGAAPSITEILVPTGKGDAYKAMLDNEVLANLVMETDEPAEPVTFDLHITCTKEASGIDLEWATDPVLGPWTEVVLGEEMVWPEGITAYFRRKGDDVALSADGLKFQMSGFANVEARGNVMAVLDKTCQSVTVGENAFLSMFAGVGQLVTAPELPATNLAASCYESMFYGCTALTDAPVLPATNLAASCYYQMFRECSSLAVAPELPARQLAGACYKSMFKACKSLTDAPALPAVALVDECYAEMFLGCKSLTNAPALSVTALAKECYSKMFSGCSSLKTAPELPAASNTETCYYRMFASCSNLNSVTVGLKDWGSLWTDKKKGNADWLDSVAEVGTFTCPAELPVRTDEHYIPMGWVVKKRFMLPAGTLMARYVVSNETNKATLVTPIEEVSGGATYEVTVGDEINVYCIPGPGLAVAQPGFVTLPLMEGFDIYDILPQPVEPVAQIVTDNGTKTNIYASLQDAFDSEFTGDPSVTNTVTLLQNVQLRASIGGMFIYDDEDYPGLVDVTARLDLNGKKITVPAEWPLMVVSKNATVIIDDLSASGVGEIKKDDYVKGAFSMTDAAVVSIFEGGNLTLARGALVGTPVMVEARDEPMREAVGVVNYFGTFIMTGGMIATAKPAEECLRVGIMGAGCNVISGGMVKDMVVFEDLNVAISGGYFGTDDVAEHSEWWAEGYVCDENFDEPMRTKGYLWKVFIPSEGTVWKPWKVGPEGSDYPQAYTNRNGELFIEGDGPVTKKPWLDDKDGITGITIKDPDTELPDDAFDGIGDDDNKIKVNLPDNWPGDLPDEDGNWYGAKVEIETWPFMVRNVRFQQRYPWNGWVDVFVDVYGPETNITLAVSAFDGENELSVENLEGNLEIVLTNGLTQTHFVWDADQDIGQTGFRSQNVTVCVSIQRKQKDDGEAFYLVGSFNGWNAADPAYIMQNKGGVYTGTVGINEATKLKIAANGGWDLNFGSKMDCLPLITKEGTIYEAEEGGVNIVVSDPGTYIVILDVREYDVSAHKGSATITVKRLENLQLVGDFDKVDDVHAAKVHVEQLSEDSERILSFGASKPGRIDLRRPIVVAPKSGDTITYSGTAWGDMSTEPSSTIFFGRNGENPVFEDLTDEGVKEFTYPEETGTYLFRHKTEGQGKIRNLTADVIVAWFIGKYDPDSVYAYDRGDGEIIIEGEGPMMDFSGCGPWGTGITGVTIRDGVTNIGKYAFRGCTEMTHVELPSTMTEIRNGAFTGATGLRTINIDAMDPPKFQENSEPFNGVDKEDVAVYVPQDAVEKYKNHENWAPFFVETLDEYVLEIYERDGVVCKVSIDGETQYEGSDHFYKALPYGSKVVVDAMIVNPNYVFDDFSTNKTFVWNFWSSDDSIGEEIETYGADWQTLQAALVGNPPEDLRGAIDYANDNGTNVVTLKRDIVGMRDYDMTLVVTNAAAVLDLNGHSIIYKYGREESVIGVGSRHMSDKIVSEPMATYDPAWLIIIDSGDGTGSITHGNDDGLKAANENSLGWVQGAHYYAGGISILSGSTCIMEGGIITNCYSYEGGGGVDNEGTFIMTGGEIADNYSDMGSTYDSIYNVGEIVITGGKVKDGIGNVSNVKPPFGEKVLPTAEPVVEISGGYYGTAIKLDKSWILEGYEIVPTVEFPGYDKKVIATPDDVLAARSNALERIEEEAGLPVTRSDKMDDLVEEARDAINEAYPVSQVEVVLEKYLEAIAARYAMDNPGVPQTVALEGNLDLRSRRELPKGVSTIDGATWSDSTWGWNETQGPVTITQMNLETGKKMTVLENQWGSSEGDELELIGQDTTETGLGHKLFHAVRGTVLESFVTFVFSGFERGTPSNPWDGGPDDHEDEIQVSVDDDPDSPPGKRIDIEGEGELNPSAPNEPWRKYANEITEIYVASGIVLQASQLAGYPNLQRIVFEDPNYRLPRAAMNGFYDDESNWVEMTWPAEGVYVEQFNERRLVTVFYDVNGNYRYDFAEAWYDGFDPIVFSTVPRELFEKFPEGVGTIEPITDENGDLKGYKITLEKDLTGPIELSDNLGYVEIDLNGHNIVGAEGSDGESIRDRVGRPAIIIRHNDSEEGEPLVLEFVDSLPDETPDVIGGKGFDGNPAGNGGPAITFQMDVLEDVEVIVGPNVTVKGGNAGNGLGLNEKEEDVPAGEPGQASYPEDSLTVCEGGQALPGDTAESGVMPWATCNPGQLPNKDWLSQLPQGLSYVGGEFWFWRRVGGKDGPVTFDFGELPLAMLAAAGLTSVNIEFVSGEIPVDTIIAPTDFGFNFIGHKQQQKKLAAGTGALAATQATKLIAKSGKSIFSLVSGYEIQDWEPREIKKMGGKAPTSGTGITNATNVWENLAFTCDDEDLVTDRCGGAIRMEGGAMRVVGCTFENCFADDYGGAIFAFGLERDSFVTGCGFVNCFVNGTYGYGGAIYASSKIVGHVEQGAGVRFTVSDATFTGNESVNGGAICTMRDANRDDLVNEQPIELVIARTGFLENWADYDGGAILAEGPVTIDDGIDDVQPVKKAGGLAPARSTSFARNIAGGAGGAIAMTDVDGEWFVPAKLSIGAGTTFSRNVASNAYEQVYGGAVAHLQPGGELEIFGAKFLDNTAIATGRSANYAYALGGAVYVDENAVASLEKTRFFGNWAVSENSYALGGAVEFLTNDIVTVTACSFDDNSAAGDFDYYGGAIDFGADVQATVKNSTFRGSNIEAVDAYCASVTFTNCVIVGNARLSGIEFDLADVYATDSTVDIAWSAYGTYELDGVTEGVFDDEANHNLPESTIDIYDPAEGAEPWLCPTGYVAAAALGLVQDATDIDGVPYGSRFWGYSMGAYECHTHRDMNVGIVVTVDPEEYVWTGKPIEPHSPKVNVYDTIVGSNLVEGVDYTLTWANNVNPTDRAVVTAIGTERDYMFTAWTNFWITAYYVDYYRDQDATPYNTEMLGELSHTNVVAKIAPPPGYVYDPITSMPTGTVRRYDGECPYLRNGQLTLVVHYYKDEGGDEVPDIYQKKMHLKVVNGWWNEELNGADKFYWVTLYDPVTGNWSTNGVGYLGENPTNRTQRVALATAGERPFTDYQASGSWWYWVDGAMAKIGTPDNLAVKSGSWPFVLFLYDREQVGGGRGGRGGRGGGSSALEDYNLRVNLKIVKFAKTGDDFYGEAMAGVVDETTGKPIFEELLRRTDVDVLATESLEKPDWKVINSQTTGGEGEWGVKNDTNGELPDTLLIKLQLR